MLTCPWCGTNYERFISNCKNCGGVMPIPEKRQTGAGADVEIPSPPLPPREVPRGYFWTLMNSRVTPIIGLVFAPLGIIFGCSSIVLTIFTGPFGLIFLILGLVFGGIGLPLLIIGLQKASQTTTVLREGVSTEGSITDVHLDITRSNNNQHPWVVHYQFSVDARVFENKMYTLKNRLPEYLQPGMPAYILYMPHDPHINTLFPPLR